MTELISNEVYLNEAISLLQDNKEVKMIHPTKGEIIVNQIRKIEGFKFT